LNNGGGNNVHCSNWCHQINQIKSKIKPSGRKPTWRETKIYSHFYNMARNLYHLHGICAQLDGVVEMVIVAETEAAARATAVKYGGTECYYKHLVDYDADTEYKLMFKMVPPDDPRNPWLATAKCDLLGVFTGDPDKYHDGIVVIDTLEA
jgi:hypothetical protein